MGTRHLAIKHKAEFVGGQLFWDMFLAYRVAWIMGRYGAGKTSLGVLMAGRLLAEKRVEHIVSNIPVDFASNITPELLSNFINAGLLLDETWIYIDTRQAVLDYAAFIRKFNHFMILPSVFPIHPRLSYFYVQRVFNAYTIGLPLWFYKWNISNKGIKEHGYFAILHPTAVFGHYPSDFVPSDDGGIGDAVSTTAARHGFKGTRTQSKRKGKKQHDEDDFGVSEDIQVMEDTASEISEAKEDLQRVAKAIQRARR